MRSAFHLKTRMPPLNTYENRGAQTPLTFKRYRPHLKNRKFGAIAISPQGEPIPLEWFDQLVPSNFTKLLECCDISGFSGNIVEVAGRSAVAAWTPPHITIPKLNLLYDCGARFKQHWQEYLEQIAPPAIPLVGEGESISDDIESETQQLSDEESKGQKLDEDGYPIDASAIAGWTDAKLADRIFIAPRARRALAKSRHPDPRRIAEALEILAGPKLQGYLGADDTVSEFEAGLLRLHMRDGFSNAERLKGQTGADYIIDLEGRRLLLSRHLRSNSSGFNDPRMVRIYYTFDKLLRKIVVGWLPSHLRTSQS